MNQNFGHTPDNLSNEAAEIANTKKISDKKHITEWLTLLKELEQYDSHTTNKAILYAKRIKQATFLLGFSIFLTYIGLDLRNPELMFFGSIAFPVSFFIWLNIYSKLKQYRERLMIIDFRKTLLPFYEIVSPELANETVSLDLNLEIAHHKKYRVLKQKANPGLLCKNVNSVFIKDICRTVIPFENDMFFVLSIDKHLTRHDEYIRIRKYLMKSTDWDVHINAKAEIFTKTSEKPIYRQNNKFHFYTQDKIPENYISPEDIYALYQKALAEVSNRKTA